MRTGQLAKQVPGLFRAGPGERGGGTGIKVRARVDAEEPEGPARVGVQVAQGPGKHVPDGGADVAAGLKQVKPPLLVRQLRGETRERGGRPGGGQLGGHSQRQRQPGAVRGQLGGRLRLGIDPGADQGPEQADGVGHRQHVQVQPPGAVTGHKPGQRVAARYHGH